METPPPPTRPARLRRELGRSLAHLLLIGVGVLAVEGYLPLHLFPPDDLAGPAPPVVERVQADYFRRGRIERQAVVAPNLIRRILLPTLGCPARIGGEGFQLVLERAPRPAERLVLVAREDLRAIDELLYALPPMPQGELVLRRRLREARERPPAGRRLASEAEQALFRSLRDDPGYGRRLRTLQRRIERETTSEIFERVRRVRHRIGRLIAREEVPTWPLELAGGESVGRVWRAEVRPGADLPAGLYALALLGPAGLVDVQLNAVYRPSAEPERCRFVVGGDVQWGTTRAVSGPALRWVSLLNGVADAEDPRLRPEHVVLVGDVVDCEIGSASSLKRQLYGGAGAYPREYLQSWLCLAALRLPLYVVPGNHDGIRFQASSGGTYVDGLLLFESTFGPQFFAFDRPPFRFVCLNSYDLPERYRTAIRTPESSWLELSDKLNLLNWGGGLREPQRAWLERQLQTELTPLVLLHHDPRGGYPAPEPARADPEAAYSLSRHFPLTADPAHRDALALRRAPRSEAHRELHLGHFTPLRAPESPVRSDEWFEVSLSQFGGPAYGGYPGWLRYQQGWHSELAYTGELSDGSPLVAAPNTLVPPARLLETLIQGRVRALFKGHDNRFCRARHAAGESVFGAAAAARLAEFGGAELLDRTRLLAPLDVFHTADISDTTSEGHGFLWVEASPAGVDVLEVDHH